MWPPVGSLLIGRFNLPYYISSCITKTILLQGGRFHIFEMSMTERV